MMKLIIFIIATSLAGTLIKLPSPHQSTNVGEKTIVAIVTYNDAKTTTLSTDIENISDKMADLDEKQVLACTVMYSSGECVRTAPTCAQALALFYECSCAKYGQGCTSEE